MTSIIISAKLNKKHDLKTSAKSKNNFMIPDNSRQFPVSKTQCLSLLISDRPKYYTASTQAKFVTRFPPKIQAKTTNDKE